MILFLRFSLQSLLYERHAFFHTSSFPHALSGIQANFGLARLNVRGWRFLDKKV